MACLILKWWMWSTCVQQLKPQKCKFWQYVHFILFPPLNFLCFPYKWKVTRCFFNYYIDYYILLKAIGFIDYIIKRFCQIVIVIISMGFIMHRITLISIYLLSKIHNLPYSLFSFDLFSLSDDRQCEFSPLFCSLSLFEPSIGKCWAMMFPGCMLTLANWQTLSVFPHGYLMSLVLPL